MPSRERCSLALGLAVVGVLATLPLAGAASAPAVASSTAALVARPFAPAPRRAVPEDRYAFANGCYTVRSLSTGGYLARGTNNTYVATLNNASAPEAFHFRALDLGKYLLFGRQGDFLSTGQPVIDGVRPVTDPVQGAVRGFYDEHIDAVRDPLVEATDAIEDGADPLAVRTSDAIVAAPVPSASAEWVVKSLGAGVYTFQLAVDDHDIATPGPLDPEIAGTLVVDGDGALRVSDGVDTNPTARFTAQQASGCARWPEPEVGITGPQMGGATAYSESSGYIDLHLHMMAYEFIGGMVRCGKPWHPYGVTYALVDCPDHQPGGHGAALEVVLSGGDPVTGHDTVGWPTFGYWPQPGSLTHEQVYYTWLERAWRGGLRLFTNLLVDNSQLCELYPLKKNSCNEMDGVRLQAQRLREIERYIDAQSGGPGEGWFRIVTDPFQARQIINAGKLAVVMGIEVSTPFDCNEILGVPECTAEQIDASLTEVYNLGVRQMELTNKFDNALTGVTGDGGSAGVIVNLGNKTKTGHYWQMETCAEPSGLGEHERRRDKFQENIADSSDNQIGRDAIFGGVLQATGTSGVVPIYPGGPHCNVIGLTDLGKTALTGMMRRGMIFDPDHMSALARKQSLDFVAAAKYSGVVSSHSWADDPTYRQIQHMGGVVAPHGGGSAGWKDKWPLMRSYADPRFTFGIGYGSDINGFSHQGDPRNPAENADVDYPFTGFGGVRVTQQRSGQRVYDINKDGVSHYGLYPDWIEDVRIQLGSRGKQYLADMANSTEAYLQMWERAVGIIGNSCRSDIRDVTPDLYRRVRRGMTSTEVLRTLGQPDTRKGNAYTYCGTRGRLTVRFGPDARVSSI